jgi:hypothetical protein
VPRFARREWDAVTDDLIPESPHTADRPSWKCRSCEEPWPCEEAKIYLLIEYHDAPTSLGLYLSLQWRSASEELKNEAMSEELWLRFIGWLHPLRRR